MSHSAKRIDWINVLFLIGTPLLAAAGLAWDLSTRGFHWANFLLFATLYAATGLSITAGYHRYWAHRTYDCARFVQVVLALFGAAAVQNSVLCWASDHRRHHRFVDTDQDPYDIMKGIFWAHMGWIFYHNVPPRDFKNVSDLVADPLLRWQHRFYVPIAVGMSLLLPAAIGALWGHPWGGLLWGGVLRVVCVHHGTFLINSAAHYWGRQPYSDRDTSRDNPLLAFLTFGEGYHNFHHAFQTDYRNGVRWYHWDPSKWLILALHRLGLAWNLSRVTDFAIQRAKLRQDERRVRNDLAGLAPALRDRLWARYADGRARFEAALVRAAALRHRAAERMREAGACGPNVRERITAAWQCRIRRARWAVALARARYESRLRELSAIPVSEGA